MKFKFRPSNEKMRLMAPGSKRKRLRLRGAKTLRAIRCKQLIPNYFAESFGRFDDKEKKETRKGFFKGVFYKASFLYTSFCQRLAAKRLRQERVSVGTMLGLLGGTVSVAIISAIVVVLSFLMSYSGRYENITVPDLVSMNAEEALSQHNDIFEYNVIYKSNPSQNANTVTAQTPLPGVTRKFYGSNKKIKLTLTVNTSEPDFTLPSLVGTSLRDALIILHSKGINVSVIKEYSETEEAGCILYCSIPEGTKIKDGDSITIKSSLGKKKLQLNVPDLSGLDEASAIELIETNGFLVGDIDYATSKAPVGTVITQSVAPHSQLLEKSKISFTVSGGIYYDN